MLTHLLSRILRNLVTIVFIIFVARVNEIQEPAAFTFNRLLPVFLMSFRRTMGGRVRLCATADVVYTGDWFAREMLLLACCTRSREMISNPALLLYISFPTYLIREAMDEPA